MITATAGRDAVRVRGPPPYSSRVTEQLPDLSALPVTVRETYAGWSIERTAGLTTEPIPGALRFDGPGRMVLIEAHTPPAAVEPAAAIARISSELADDAEAELTETDGDLLRRAYLLTTIKDGQPRHDLYGYAAVPGALISAVCVYEDPDDRPWAEQVWRSIRRD